MGFLYANLYAANVLHMIHSLCCFLLFIYKFEFIPLKCFQLSFMKQSKSHESPTKVLTLQCKLESKDEFLFW